MKVRNGFVTNSSSSSFILTKESCHLDEEITLELAFIMVRECYRRVLDKYSAIRENLVLVYGEDNLKEKLKEEWMKDYNARKPFEATYGISAYDAWEWCTDEGLGSLSKLANCKTLDEFQQKAPYWLVDLREVFEPLTYNVAELVYWYKDAPYDEDDPATKEKLLQLGTIAGLGECGDIPTPVYEEIKKISAYCCNHMG